MRPALVPILLADPLPWAKRAEYAWDFLRDRARFAGGYKGALANTPGWTFTRASTGYYTTTGGVLVPFASGSLRTGDRGALIEGAGTNLQIKSQTFDNASWTKTRASVSADAAVAPDGTTTADKLIEDNTSSASHFINETGPTLTTTTAYTVSVYAKAAERSQIGLNLNASVGLATPAVFDLSTGAVVTGGSFTASMQALGNGWYRCIATGTTTGSANSGIIIRTCLAGATSYNGDGTSGIYLWGAQLEAASFPSSYIPTTTASATRAADTLKITGLSGLAHPLSLYCEIERALDTGATEGLIATYADGSNFAELFVSSSGKATCATTGGGSKASAASVGVGSTAKIAGRCATNDVNVALNGTAATADTTATMPSSPTEIWFGEELGTGVSSRPFGYIRRAAIWPRALTNAELQSVTT